jgi:nucleoid DNA-binding protein
LGYTEYIRNLLLFSGKVTFPGLGSLEMVKVPARMTGNRIMPPGTSLVFNRELSMDDGKLAGSIASSGETDIEEARQQVLEFVDQILFSLNKGEPFIFEGIGKLFRDENNIYQFEKDPGFITDFDSFGLESFELEPEESGELPVKEVQTETADNVTPEPQEEIKPVPVREEIPVITEPYRKAGSRRGMVWYITGAMVFIIAGLVLLNEFTDFPGISVKDILKRGTGQQEFSQTEDEPGSNPDDLKQVLDSMSASGHPLIIVDKTQSGILKIPSDTEIYREYHIIAGSFRDTVNARELARELTMDGYPVIILRQGENLFRVSALSFKDRESGLEELHRFRANTRNNAAWLLELSE